MDREVIPELLDELPPDDPRAIWSRRDLRRINACMGQSRILAHALDGAFGESSPRSIVDLGGGDGVQLLRLAKRIASRWHPMRATVVDRQNLLTPRIKSEFEALSWSVESVGSDIFDWLERSHPESSDIVVTSLFLHHFKEPGLRRLLQGISKQTGFFVASEPRRANFPFVAASLLGFIGCNSVTRHDAKISVRAGFVGKELSALWPSRDAWRLSESEAGLFNHCFVAQRVNAQTL